MPFKQPPHPHLRQWDEAAGEVACTAQIMYMAGRLDITFDRGVFDRRVGRKPGSIVPSAGCLRLMLHNIPFLTILEYSPLTLAERMRPKKLRASLERQGMSESAITNYLRGPHFRIHQERIRDAMKLQRNAPHAYQVAVGDNLQQRAQELLKQRAVLYMNATQRSAQKHCILLIPQSNLKGGDVEVYDPKAGLYVSSVQQLIQGGHITPEETGFTSYLVS